MAKDIKMKVNVDPQIDKEKIKQALAGLNNLSGIKVGLDIDDTDAMNALEDLQQSMADLEEMAAQQIDVNLDVGASEAALEELQRKLDGVEGADINMDELAAGFQKAQKEAENLAKTQQSALAQMKLSGQEGTDAYKKLNSEFEATQGTLKKMTGATKEFGDAAQKPAGAFADLFLKFEALSRAAETMQKWGEQGLQVRDAMNEVKAATGANVEELAKIRAMAEDAFVAGVGESVAESIKIMGQAKKTLGSLMSDEEISKFTKGAAAIAQSFGKDTMEVVNGSKTFIANFGLDGEKAFNLVALGMQKTGNAQDDLLDTLNEYSAHVKRAGYDADEFVGVLNTGLQKGVWNTDKLGDAIKETQVRLNEGDISKTLYEMVATYGEAIPTQLRTTLTGIVSLGEQGKMSTKEVLQTSAEEIGKAFDAGKITGNIRDKLGSAFSGTMAEDIGGKFWTDIFGAKIDTSAIKSQAAKAGEDVMNALGPVSAIEQIQKQLELFSAKASSYFAPYIQAAGGMVTTLAQVAPGISLIKDSWEGISTGGAKAWSFVKNIVMTSFTSIKAAFVSGEVSATAFWSAATLGVAILIPILIELYNNFEGFRKVVDGVAGAILDGFKLAWNFIKAFVSNFGSIVSAVGEMAAAYLNPANWFSSDGSELRAKAKKKLSDAINGAIQDATADLKKSKLDQAMADAMTIKGDLDKNNKLKDLIDRFKNAKTEAEKNSLAKAIQDQVPGAISGMKTVVDANGKLVEVYDVNIGKAEQFADAQGKLYDDKLKSKQNDWKIGVQDLSATYDRSKEKLDQLGKKIVEVGSNGGDVSGLKKDYDELAKTVQGNADNLGKAAEEGKKLGYVKADAKDMGSAFKISSDAAAIISSKIRDVANSAAAAKGGIQSLAQAFAQAKAASDAGVTALQGEMAGLKLKQQNEGLDEAQKKRLGEINKMLEQSRGVQDNIARISQNINDAHLTREQRIQNELDKSLKQIDNNDQIKAQERDLSLIIAGRESSVYDEIAAQDQLIAKLQQTKAATQKALSSSPSVSQSREFKNQLKDIDTQLAQAGEGKLVLTAKVGVEQAQIDLEIAKIERDNKQKRIEFNIALGLADETDLIKLLGTDLDKIGIKKAELFTKLAQAQESGDLAARNDLIQKIDALNGEEMDGEKALYDAKTALLDRYEKKEQESLDKRLNALKEHQDAEKAMWDEQFQSWQDAAVTAIDSASAIRLDHLDKSEQLELQLSGDSEDAKAAITAKYEAMKKDAQDKANSQKLVAQAAADGAERGIVIAQEIAILQAKKDSLEVQKAMAIQAGNLNLAESLAKEITKTNDALVAKSDILLNSAQMMQEGLGGVFDNLFAGNGDAAKDGMKKNLAQIGGYLKQLLQAFVTELILTSAPIKALAAGAGLFAPVVLGGIAVLLNSAMNALLSPILQGLLSFSTGGRVDSATMYMAGDGNVSGGDNREWIFRDEQLKLVLGWVLGQYEERLAGYFARLESLLTGQRIVGKIEGSDMLLLNARAQAEDDRRNRT